MSVVPIVNSESQLFIDDYCIEQLDGVRKRFHQAHKHPKNPLLQADMPWEATYVQLYGNVLQDPDLNAFRMWYTARYLPDGESRGFNTICHAISPDGIHWERTAINRLKHKGLVLGNAVIKGEAIGPTVFYTPDDPDPERRYRMFVYTGNETYVASRPKAPFSQHYGLFFSPDGYVWNAYENNPVVQGGDIATCMYDPVTKEYIAIVKIHRSDEGFNRRCVGVSLSRDFETWLTPNIILSADAIDDARVPDRLERFRNLLVYDNPQDYRADMYGMTAFRCGEMRLGLIWLFDISADRPREAGGNNDGPVNIQLAYSRHPDAYTGWKRTENRHDVISCGPEGSYDGGAIYTAHMVLDVGDEHWIYYTGVNHTHGNRGPADKYRPFTKTPWLPPSLNLAVIRREGFVSIEALWPGGCLTTREMTIKGDSLHVNVDASAGSMEVEITDPQGRIIDGFAREDCIAIRENKVSLEVRWKNARFATLREKNVRIKFYMQAAQLYAFSCPTGA